MRRLRWVLVGAALLAALAALAWWWFGGAKPKLTVLGLGFPLSSGYRLHTVVEQRPGKVIVRRVQPDGTVRQLGEHSVPAQTRIQVCSGVGDYYAMSMSPTLDAPLGAEHGIRVYDAGRELYRVPSDLMRWGTRVARGGLVLANGTLLVGYALPVPPTEIRPDPNPVLLRLIAHGPAGVRSYDLVTTPIEVARYAIAGDGSVVAIALGERPSPAGIKCDTVVFSAADGKVLRTIEKFAVYWISHDGRRMLGHKTNAVALYEDGRCIAEKPTKGILVVTPCAEGKYASCMQGGTEIGVLDMKSLEAVATFRPSAGREIADHAIASDGRLAICEYTRTPSRKIESRLVIYQLDGKVIYTQDFGTTDGWAVRSPTWFAGGKVLLYVNEAMTRIVRLTP